MRAGDRLGDRFRLEAPRPTTQGVRRFDAIDEATGAQVEVLALGAARGSSDDRRAFRDVHHAMRAVEGDAVAAAVHVEHTETEAWAVRGRLDEATLADLSAPLDARLVAAIGARLIPAVVEAGEATRGTLLPTDVGLDADGRPTLAPWGTPLNQVVRGTTRAVAPEVLAGRPADGAAGLYGLGVLLYRLATGREPAATTGGAPPAPPSAARHGIPEALDEAILRLLSPDPGRRVGARPLLETVADGEVAKDLGRFVRPKAVVGEVTLTPAGSSEPRKRRRGPPRALVVVPHRDLAELDPAGRHAAAGLAGVSLDVVDEAIDKRLPLAVGGAALRVAAERDAEGWRQATGLPLKAGVADAGRGFWLPLVAALAIGAPLALLTGLLAVFGVLWLAVPAAVALAVDGVFAGMTWLTMRRWSADFGVSTAAWQLVEDHRSSRAELGLKPVSDDLAGIRRQIAQADLAPAAAADLRSVLKEVDQKVESLAERAEASAAALRQVDGAGLRGRLSVLNQQTSLDAAQSAERDRLTRIVADLDDVRARQASVLTEGSRLRDALAEVASVLGQLGDDPPDEALAALGTGARRVEEAVRARGADEDESARRRERLLAQARAERSPQ